MDSSRAEPEEPDKRLPAIESWVREMASPDGRVVGTEKCEICVQCW